MIDFNNYFAGKRFISEMAKKHDLKQRELEAIIYMGENGFEVPLKRDPSLKRFTTEYIAERGAMIVPKRMGLGSAGSIIPDLVRKGMIKKLTVNGDQRKTCVELTTRGSQLYKSIKELETQKEY